MSAESKAPASGKASIEQLRTDADRFKDAMLQKMLDHVRYKHPEDPLDPWNKFDSKFLENRLVDEFCEYFGIQKEGHQQILGIIQDTIWTRIAWNLDPGRAGPLHEPNVSEESLDIANFCFFLWMQKEQDSDA
jgi:hypothetical protein